MLNKKNKAALGDEKASWEDVEKQITKEKYSIK